MTSKYIESLLLERRGYEQRGMVDRIKLVDAALRELGYESKYMTQETETAAVEPQVERSAKRKSKKREI